MALRIHHLELFGLGFREGWRGGDATMGERRCLVPRQAALVALEYS